MTIDCHVHVKGGDQFHREFDAETILAAMDRAGVDKAVIFAICAPSRESNEMTRRQWAKCPERLIPFAHTVMDEGELGAHEVGRAVCEWGFRGVKLHFGETRRGGEALTPEMTDPIFAKIEALGVPCLVDCAQDLATMTRVTAAFPSLRFIIAHLGSPSDERLVDRFAWLAHERSNVWLDCSYCFVPFKIREVVELLGPRKVIWGSDGLLWHPLTELQKIKLLDLPAEDEARILGGNIAELLGIA